MKYYYPYIDGWMSARELEWLYGMACEMGTVVEIGSWMGKSTHALLSGCKGTVFAVDHFKGSPSEIDGPHARAKTEDIYEIFKKNVGNFPNLIVLKMDSVEASKRFKDKSVDMVFIDGDHEPPQPRKDIEAWLPKTRKLICGHDMTQAGVPMALQELGITPKQADGTQIWRLDL